MAFSNPCGKRKILCNFGPKKPLSIDSTSRANSIDRPEVTDIDSNMSLGTADAFMLFFFKVDSPCQCGLANGKGDDAPINRVINGQQALPNEFPWQVALVRAGGHTPICGGSIISDRHVLTAAHCTNDIKGKTQLF